MGVIQKPLGASSLALLSSNSSAVKITVVGNITYIGKASPGALQASSVWQACKIDETTGLVMTWADGNSAFDNVATDLTSLSYS